jgi:hypothetical protein
MENPTNCPLPPRRFHSKFQRLLFTLSSTYILAAIAALILVLSYAVFFTVNYAKQEQFKQTAIPTTAIITNFEVISHTSKNKNINTYRYTLSYPCKDKTCAGNLRFTAQQLSPNINKSIGEKLQILLNSNDNTDIRYVTELNQYNLKPNLIIILLFTLIAAFTIRYQRAIRIKTLPLFEMGLPAFATITKTNRSGLSTSEKSFVQYHLAFVAFDGNTYNATTTAKPYFWGKKKDDILVLYNLNNPEENIIPDTFESSPICNADSTLSLNPSNNIITSMFGLCLGLFILACIISYAYFF